MLEDVPLKKYVGTWFIFSCLGKVIPIWVGLIFLQCKLHFSQPNPFFVFSLQDSGVYGSVEIIKEGYIVSYIGDNDKPNAATITGTAIVEMQPGQKVLVTGPLFMLHETNNNTSISSPSVI